MYTERRVELSSWNPPGDLGTYRTLGVMGRYANRALEDPLLVELAQRIIRDVGTQDEPGKIRALRGWLDRATRFLDDPLGVELIRTPRRLILTAYQLGYFEGDCDDVAVLAAALGKAVGLPARYVVVGFEPGGPFRHVYAELWDGQEWRELDVTRPAQQLPTIQRRETRKV